jgi:hypothetical protein
MKSPILFFFVIVLMPISILLSQGIKEEASSNKKLVENESVADDSAKQKQDPKEKEPSQKSKTNSTFQSNWFTSKVGEGFTITSDDGESLMNIRIRGQMRSTSRIVPEDKQREGTTFEIRRLRMINRGKIKGDEWHYNVQLGFAERDQEIDKDVPLRDAIITYNGFNRIKFSFGQMKVPFNRQRLISSGALQLPDRSIVNGELNLDRDVGIQAFSNNLFGLSNRFSINLGVFGGDGKNRTSQGPGLLTIGKLTYYPLGNFLRNRLAGVDDELLAETDFARERSPKIAIGFAGAFNKNTNRERSTLGAEYRFARFDYTHYASDIMLKWMGYTLLTEFISRKANLPYQERNVSNQIQREYSRSMYGYFVQTSYLFKNNWELTARWGEYKPWDGTNPNVKYGREVGAGVSYYFSKHNLKWQADYFKLNGDPALTIGSYEIRSQLQLFY